MVMILICGCFGIVCMVGDGVYIQTIYETMVSVNDLGVCDVMYHAERDESPKFTTAAGFLPL